MEKDENTKPMIEVKDWNEYSKEEKKELLTHWWHYYGKLLITLEEWEKFNELVDKNTDKVFEQAIASYIHGLGSEVLVYAIRANKVDGLFTSLPNIEENENEEFKKAYAIVKTEFIKEIVTTYNNPEPSIPMNPIDVIAQVVAIAKTKKKKKKQ